MNFSLNRSHERFFYNIPSSRIFNPIQTNTIAAINPAHFSNLSANLFKKIPEYIKNYPFLSEVDSCSLRNSITDLMIGFDRYYKKLGGYPNYQKRGVKESYRTNCNRSSYKGKEYASIEVDMKEKTITLPRLKKVKIRGYRNLEQLLGRILNATIKQVGYKYYVSVCVEEELEIPVMSEKRAIGIDVGVKNMVVTSDFFNLDKVIVFSFISTSLKNG